MGYPKLGIVFMSDAIACCQSDSKAWIMFHRNCLIHLHQNPLMSNHLISMGSVKSFYIDSYSCGGGGGGLRSLSIELLNWVVVIILYLSLIFCIFK